MGLQTQSLGQSEACDHTILMVSGTDFKKMLSKEKVAPRILGRWWVLCSSINLAC
jgi:hypothetical protein